MGFARARRLFAAGLPVMLVTGVLVPLGAAAAGAAPARGRDRAASAARTATEPGPLVPFNSVDYDASNRPGVVVGSQRYPLPPGGSIQAVAIDRRTLELRANRSFTTEASGLSSLKGFLQGLDATVLVFVTNPAGPASAEMPRVQRGDAGGLNAALALIGAAYPAYWALISDYSSCWSGGQQRCYLGSGWRTPAYPSVLSPFTFAGVPGMAAGQGWRDLAVQRDRRDGRLSGYLTHAASVDDPGAANTYTIVHNADGYVRVDTCVSGGPGACVIRVGTQSYAPPAGADGLFVLQLDRTTLEPLRQRVVSTAADLADALGEVMLSRDKPGHVVFPGVDDQRVFVVQSVGSGRLSGGDRRALQYIDQVGGTIEALTGAVTKGKPYALVGVASDLPWSGTGAESSPEIDPSQKGNLRGELVRDRDSRFAPQTADPAGGANLDLYGILYQDLAPWSFANSPVLPYVAGQIDLPPDVRSSYPNRLLDFGTKLTRLLHLQCPADHDAQHFTCVEFGAVQNQLAIEFEGVTNVRNLLDSIKQPFFQSGQTQQFAVQVIASQIQASLQPPAGAQSNWGWLKWFAAAMTISSALANLAGQPGLGVAFGFLATASKLGNELMNGARGEGTPDITSQVGQLGGRLAKQNQSQLQSLGLLELILVADQGKLLAVHAKAGTDPAWTWTQATTNHAADALNAAARASTYTDLMPLAWPLWNLQPAKPQSDPTTSEIPCSGVKRNPSRQPYDVFYPFHKALPANQFQAVTDWDGTGLTTQTWTFARMDNVNSWWDGPAANTTLPTTSLTDQLFSLGGDGAGQYAPRWFRHTYNPPGRAVCFPTAGSDSFLKQPARADVGPKDVMVR